MPPVRAFGRLAVMLAVSLARSSRAQEQPAAGEEIEVAGKKTAASARAPAAQSTVIDTAEFAGEVRSVSEMVSSAPGVSVHALGGPGQATTLSLRGASADQSLILLDGIPLQAAGGGAVDLSTIPAMLLERLVLSKGVLGAQFGAGALGGALELFPRKQRGETAAGVQASFGTFTTAQVAADGAMSIGDGSGLLAVQLDRTSGDFDYQRQLAAGGETYDFTRENADAKRGSALGRYSTPLPGSTELDVLLHASAGERGVPGRWTQPTPDSRQADATGLAGLAWRNTEGELAWSARAWGRLDRIDLTGQQAFGSAGGHTDQRGSALQGDADLAGMAGDHRLKAVLSGGSEWVHGVSTGSHQRTRLAAGVSDDWTAGAGFSFHPAIRLDKTGDVEGASPGIAALWKRGPLELRAGWGLSFRAPSFNELYLTSGGIGSNPALLPERAWSVDAGAAWRKGKLTISGGIFWSQYRDLIVYEQKPSANAVTPLNIGAAHLAGLELQAIVPLPAGFMIEAAYSYLDAVNDRPGEQQNEKLSYRPPHRLFARLARRGDRLEGYAETSFTSEMPRNQYGTATLPSQLLINAGFGARVAGPLWVDLDARNLLNDQTLEDVFQYPLPGFSLAVVARARL